MEIFLLILCILFLGATAFFAYKLYTSKLKNMDLEKQNLEYFTALEDGQKAVDLALKYEDFFNSTVGDIGEIVDTLKAVVGKRQMLSDDPDVQNLIRILAIAHDTLLSYVNARSPSEQVNETSNR